MLVTMKRALLAMLLGSAAYAAQPTVTVMPVLNAPAVGYASTGFKPYVLVTVKDSTATPTHYAVVVTYRANGESFRLDQIIPRQNLAGYYDAVTFFVVPAEATGIEATVTPSVAKTEDVVRVAVAQ